MPSRTRPRHDGSEIDHPAAGAAGLPTGGRFAATGHDESPVSLADATPVGLQEVLRGERSQAGRAGVRELRAGGRGARRARPAISERP